MELNPIQKKTNAGMNSIVAFLSEATCGAACWEAREDVCHCSCGGKNHGCMRGADGTQPQRTAKIDGFRYVLAAVDASYGDAARINDSFGKCRRIGSFAYGWSETDKGAPARLKLASDTQMASWPELKSYREAREEVQRRVSWCWAEVPNKPHLLWVREDVKLQAAEAHNG
jgi:hypothetical protein